MSILVCKTALISHQKATVGNQTNFTMLTNKEQMKNILNEYIMNNKWKYNESTIESASITIINL